MGVFTHIERELQKNSKNAKEGYLRVWHIPQIPGKPFHVYVKNISEAKLILKVIAHYDLFQLENHIKPDFSNAAGLEIFENNEWVEWYSPEGEDIDEYTN